MKYDKQNTIDHYDNFGENEWERLEKNRLGELLYNVHLDIIKRYIGKDDEVIEFASGSGRFTKDIVKISKSLVTSDLSQVQLDINKKKMKELGVYDKIKSFNILDITDLSKIEDNKFDVAVCTGGAINYLFDKEKTAIREMLRILKPNGRLILGAISKIGALMYYMDGVLDEKQQFGIDATKWIFDTGLQEKEHYPVQSKHYVHMMTSKDMDELFKDENVKILEKSSAGLFGQCKEEILNNSKKDNEFWNNLLENEKRFTKYPGTLDCGMNIIYVIKKL